MIHCSSRWTIQKQEECKKIFAVYNAVSGHAINLRKSSITFGSKVSPDVKTRMRNILGIHNEGGIRKYLGLPEKFGNKGVRCLHTLSTRSKKLTQGWNQKFLSQGGKELLLKVVALAIPIYSINVFRLI